LRPVLPCHEPPPPRRGRAGARLLRLGGPLDAGAPRPPRGAPRGTADVPRRGRGPAGREREEEGLTAEGHRTQRRRQPGSVVLCAPAVRRRLTKAAGGVLTAKTGTPHRPGTAPALGLRARIDVPSLYRRPAFPRRLCDAYVILAAIRTFSRRAAWQRERT